MTPANHNPWLTQVTKAPEVRTSIYGWPLDKNGKLVFGPYTRPEDPEMRATDALLVGQLKATYVFIQMSASNNQLSNQLSNGPLAEPLIITTPNADYLPDINLGKQTVFSRSDGRWGPEDWTQWPQWYFEDYDHLPYISRRPPGVEEPTHSLHRIWWNMTEDAFVEEPGFQLAGVGRLRHDIVTEFYTLRDKLMVKVNGEDLNRSPALHRKLHQAAARMRHATSTLRHAPQTFSDVLLTVTAAQRYYLETQAIFDKATKFDTRSLDGTKYEADLSLMGTVTNCVGVAYELFEKGVPVWLVRPTARVPKTTIIRLQDYPIQPGPSRGVVLKQWPGAPVFYSGPRSPGMYFVTDQWHPGSIDFSNVGLEGSTPQIPEAPASSSKQGTNPYPKPKEADTKLRMTVTQIGINFERFKLSSSPRSSRTTADWAEGLQRVKADPSRILKHPQHTLFRGYTFPDALAFLDDKKGSGYLLAWLVIRPSWMSVLTGFEPRCVALPNPQQWRTYLHGIVHDFELLGEDKRKLPPQNRSQPPQTSRTSRRKQKSKDAASDMFTCRLPNRADLTTLSWNDHVVWALGSVDLQLVDYQLASWDSQEHNFRAELVNLDRCIMVDVWKNPRTAIDREQKLRAVFFSEVFLMISVPSGFKSIASSDVESRCPFVEAFRLVLIDWPGDGPAGLKDFQCCKEFNGEETWDLEAVHAVEKIAYPFYCQTFFDYFGRAPSVPHTYPV